MTETKVEGPSLTLTHHVDAQIERVYRAFTEAAQLRQWFGPEGFQIIEALMDAKVGGTYRIEMQAPDEEHESLVTIKLQARQGGTDIELTHTQLASEESAEKHNQGWTSTFCELSSHLQVA